MPTVALSSAKRIFGSSARLASDYPGAQHIPLDYPGRRPETSFLYLDGLIALVRESPSLSSLLIDAGSGETTIDEFLAANDLVPFNQRYAVLAVGSNACPGRLEEKFIGKDHDAIIALKGWIADVDSIYAAWLADYGALPATIAEAPGTEVEIWLTLLTQAQLTIMNASEGLGDDYSLVSVASPFRVGLAMVENVYAYFDRRALVLEGEHVRVGDFSAQNPKLRSSLTEKEALAIVLDKLEFACGQSIEQRHRAMTGIPSVIGNLNARLTKSFTGINAHSHTIVPAPTGELQLMQWIRRPMMVTIDSIRFKAHQTNNRDDARGEFIIRLNAEAMRLLPHRCKYVVVRSITKQAWAKGKGLVVPEVIAAVRRLLPEERKSLKGCDDIRFCQLDMSLRVSIGVQGYDTTNNEPLKDKTGNDQYFRVERPSRSIRPIGWWLGYQWMLFRVHRALDGDWETPICRVRQRYLASLGIHDGGVVVVESVAKRATRRLLAANDNETEETEDDIGFEGHLGAAPLFRFPCIYMDLSTRSQLDAVPGQVVWVRRELWSVVSREFLKNASALALAFLGIAFSVRELVVRLCPDHQSWGDWSLGGFLLLSVGMILWCAYDECRSTVRSK